ncbi:MAG: AAA family ATPase [Clostridia bacterium]|nr:AAA family ATPase [Clostridia bacterium]MDQ7790661.1 AAA family ATPase [Clostridia bacterium]
MPVAVRTLLVHSDPLAAKEITEWFAEVEDIEIVESTNLPSKALLLVSEYEPDVVILDDRIPEAHELAEQIGRDFLNSGVIILGTPPAEDAYRKGMQAGVRDVVMQPFRPLDLADAIYKSYDYGRKRRLIIPQFTEAPPEAPRAGTKFITVFSPKGGVGKSTIAVNLAVALATKKGRNRVVLWDLDLHNGIVNVATNMVPKRPITDLINEIQYLDAEMMESYLETHSSGLQVLCSPFTPEFADYVSSDNVAQIMSALRNTKDYVIIDTSPFFHDPVMTAMEQSNCILLIGSLDVASVKNLKAGLMVMDSLQYPRSKIKLIINRGNIDFGVLPRDVEVTLKLPIMYTLPSEDRVAVASLNEGSPVVQAYAKADLGRSFIELADLIISKFEQEGASSAPARKPGLFGRRRRAAGEG